MGYPSKQEGRLEPAILYIKTVYRSTPPALGDACRDQTRSTILYAASSAEDLLLNTEKDLDTADNETSRKMEIVRSHLRKTQYKHLRYVVCDGLSFREIAERTGHSITNVRIILLNTRKKMLDLVPHHLKKGIESCLLRN